MIRLSLILACLAGPLMADPSDLREMETGVDSQGWEAVGRLNIGRDTFCTGTLIAEDLVLTAAHCLHDEETGAIRPADTPIEFLAGWRGGQAMAYRNGRRFVVSPRYGYQSEDQSRRVGSDVALIELDQPIRNPGVLPFVTGRWPAKGASVSVVSYGEDRAAAPSIQETCTVLARQAQGLVTDCDVVRGSSGAPVFETVNGVPTIVSVISAKAKVRDIDVSLGSNITPVLDEMRTELATSDGVFTSVTGTSGTVVQRNGGAAGTAKFMRP